MKNKLFLAVSLVAVLVFPFAASAQTVSTTAMSVAQMQAEIALLLAQLQALQQQLATAQGGTAAWCYTFNTNLSIGMTGAAITALQTALSRDGESVTINGTFDDQTASAVTGFQQKYAAQILTPNGLQNGTGYAGKATRAKLNALFGCVSGNPVPVTTAPVLPLAATSTTATSSATAAATSTAPATTTLPTPVPPPAPTPTSTISTPTSTATTTPPTPTPVPSPAPNPAPITTAASGACVLRDSYTNMPAQSNSDNGQGYAKVSKPGVSNISGLQGACSAQDYTNLLQSYCASNSNSAQQEVVVYDTNGNVMSTSCGAFGCASVACASLTASAPVTGACVIRDGGTSMPGFYDPDNAHGYAKMSIAGVNTISGLQASCSADDYASLLSTYCASNSSAVQEQVVTYGTGGGVQSSSCGSGGCNFVACP